MRWLWSDWGSKRGRSQTRPRVARAVQVARLAQGAAMRVGETTTSQGASATLGSAYADTRAVFFAPEVAPTSGVLYWEAGQTGWERLDRRDTQSGLRNTQTAGEAKNYLEHFAYADAMRTPDERDTLSEAPYNRGHDENFSHRSEAKAARRARRGLTTTLLRATAEVAQTLGRAPEEALAEALQAWLAAQESRVQPEVASLSGTSATAPRRRPMEVRRQEVWGDIDATMKALRAS
ncbi:MAG TPA: hypothetical protein VKQ36_11935 [Ktedonobacterales bacterium]|nr:hypothetical protein [Ktedonobacterales bacterium]